MREALVMLLFTVGLAGWAHQARQAEMGLLDAAVAVGLCLAAALAMMEF